MQSEWVSNVSTVLFEIALFQMKLWKKWNFEIRTLRNESGKMNGRVK